MTERRIEWYRDLVKLIEKFGDRCYKQGRTEKSNPKESLACLKEAADLCEEIRQLCAVERVQPPPSSTPEPLTDEQIVAAVGRDAIAWLPISEDEEVVDFVRWILETFARRALAAKPAEIEECTACGAAVVSQSWPGGDHPIESKPADPALSMQSRFCAAGVCKAGDDHVEGCTEWTAAERANRTVV